MAQTMIPFSRSAHAPAGVVGVKLALWNPNHGIVVDTCSPGGRMQEPDPSQSRALFLGHSNADKPYYYFSSGLVFCGCLWVGPRSLRLFASIRTRRTG